MSEETMNVYEDDWADIMDDFDEADQTLDESEQDNANDERAEKPAEEPTENAEQEQDAANTDGEPGEQQVSPEDAQEELFTLKHLGVESRVTRDEALVLAQKGMDYDRIRSQRDELIEYRKTNESIINLVSQLAEAKGMTVQQYTDHLQVQRMMAQQGLSQELATERLAREKAEAALNAQTQQKQEAQDAETERNERIRADLSLFQSKYNVDLNDVPQEVWHKVTDTTLLTEAYGDYLSRRQKDAEIQNLKAQLKAQEQNIKNQQTTTGSRAGSVEDENDDPFLAAFMSD